jgi:hypothetical protein
MLDTASIRCDMTSGAFDAAKDLLAANESFGG